MIVNGKEYDINVGYKTLTVNRSDDMSQRTVKSFFKTFKDEADSIYCDPNFERFKIQEWLLENKCSTLQECWEKIPADALLWMATRRNVLTQKDFQQFALSCCNRLNHLMKDKRSLNAFHTTKEYINGETTKEDLICDMNSVQKFIEDRPPMLSLSTNEEELILQSSWNAGHLGYGAAVLVCFDLVPMHQQRLAFGIATSAANAVFFSACANYDDYTDRVIEVGLERTRQSNWFRENCTPNFTKSTRAKKLVTFSFCI
jgi:hypothetical protein